MALPNTPYTVCLAQKFDFQSQKPDFKLKNLILDLKTLFQTRKPASEV
jgi:hypothetical protein